MLFKISDKKMDYNSGLNENSLMFMKTHISNIDSKVCDKKVLLWWSRKWIPCLLSVLILVSLIVSLLFYLIAVKDHSSKTIVSNCQYKHKTGNCIDQHFCCSGENVIGKHLCGGTQFCCLGSVTKCPGNQSNKRADLWSFQSLMQISSTIVFRNTSESLVEQSVVIALSAIERMEYYYEMSEKIGEDMSSNTQHKWFSIVGNKDSFDLNLNQFSAFILISINEIDVLLLRTQINIIPNESFEYNSDEINGSPNHLNYDQDYDFATRPSFEIIRNELNESMKEMVIQIIDYVINQCINNYKCITSEMVESFNYQIQNNDSKWQFIITTNTDVNQMFVNVDHLKGSLLDVIYNKRHRILIFKTGLKAKINELQLINSGRKALATNKTIIVEKSSTFKLNDNIIKDIDWALKSNNKLQTICQDLTSKRAKHINSLGCVGCVAGDRHSFSYLIQEKLSDNYLVIKLNDLQIILFKRFCNKGVYPLH